MAYTLSSLRTYVRDLTGVYSTDLVPNSLLTSWINEVYFDVARQQVWPWLPITALSADGDAPAFSDEFRPLLAYRVAAKVLATQADDTNRSQVYLEEYQALLTGMYQGNLTDNASTATSTRANLASFVRTLLNEYSRRIPTALINTWLSEEYVLLASDQDWPWLESQYQTTVTAGTNTVVLPSGSKKVLEVFFVKLVNGSDTVTAAVNESEIVYPVPSVLDGSAGDPYFRYDIAYDGTMTLTPAPSSAITLRVRYVQAITGLTSDASEPSFDAKFRSLLAYRVAVRVLDYLGVASPMRDTYVGVSQATYDEMYSAYMLDHSTEPLQLGGRGLETRKYLPWFRTP